MKNTHSTPSHYYELQKKSHDSSKIIGEWNNHKSVDYWRHQRMYRFLDPILSIEKKSSWVTIGDGRYGHDANYILSHGSKCLATDLSTKRLAYAKANKYINNYQQENAEKLSFKDSSFDYVFCKESYHHFPRPSIALYEMIRVSKKAVILIEPNDVKRRGLSIKGILGIEETSNYVNGYEISGNFVYGLTRREIQKFALGLGVTNISFAGIDDDYIKGVEDEKISQNGPLYKKIKLRIMILDILHKLGLRDRSLLVSIIWKITPSNKLMNLLSKYGYVHHILPLNPYL